MPGVFATIDSHGRPDPRERLEPMLQATVHHPWYRTEPWADNAAGVAMGRVSLGLVNTAPQPVVAEDGNLVVVMDGELYDCAQQRAALEKAGCIFAGESHAEVLLHGYLREGKTFFARLNGKFVATLWDAARRRLVALNDRFGVRPLYYCRLDGRLLVSSEIKALLTDPDVPRTPSARGLSQFFTFGHYLGVDTSLEAVRLLPPAGWLQYDVDADELSVDAYWSFDPPTNGSLSEREWLDRMDHALKQAVDCRTLGTERLGLSLSGGMDARTILGLIDHDRVPVTTISLGIPGCRDHRSAEQLAAMTNRRHHNYVLRHDFLANYETHLRRMVHLTDGQYLSQCIVMPTLPFYRELGIDVLLRGHAGELMHMTKAYNFSLDQAAMQLADAAAVEQWAFDHLRAYMLEAVDGPLFAGSLGKQTASLARESLGQCLRESAGWAPPVQQIWHLFLTQRMRRETVLSLVKFGSMLETRLPYVDNDLVDLLMTAPPEMKLDEHIQAEILRRRRPEFLQVVNVNTGTRVGAGALARRAASLRQRVLAKLRVPGYQPYERLGLWLRRELRPTVEKLLLDDRCLSRGIFDPDTARQTIDEHLQGRRNHTFLVMAMMVHEQGQRMFVDEKEPACLIDCS